MFHYNNIDNIQLCMDVPFVDHPYLIGPRGRKCQHLMDRYKSLVHFPDSNRRQNGPKLNNVVINGSSKNAEELRFQLRSRTPIRLAIQLQNFPNAFELADQMESAIAERSLPIRMNCSEDYSSAMLKTEWRNEEALISFCDKFLSSHSALMYATNNADDFTMALTILPIVNPWNPEISHWLIEHIFDVTGCRVFYPPKEKFADQPPSYFIKGGSAAGVLKAGKFMLGLTMFQVSFIVPNSVHLNLDKISDWQKELLVHTSIEPVYSANNNNNNNNNSNVSHSGSGSRNSSGGREFLHNRAVLRSFEFCLNNVYFVRSLLLGFKKTVQSSFYNFMDDVKQLISPSVFSNAQLYYPLYAIDDERSFNWETIGEEFFQKFYGGPYSTNASTNSKQPRTCKSPIEMHSSNSNLTSGLKELLNIRICDDSANSSAMLEVARNSPATGVLEALSPPLNHVNLDNSVFMHSSPTKTNSIREYLHDDSKDDAFELDTSSHQLGVLEEEEVEESTTLVLKPDNDFKNSLALVLVSPCISSNSPGNVDHEDDPELQAILRRTMPCLQVTQEQVNSLDHEAISRALMTADDLAKLTNSSHRPFLYAEYAVSYPANVSLEEFQGQFKEFVKMRNRYFQLRNLTSSGKRLYAGHNEKSRVKVTKTNNSGRSLRKSTSF